MARPVGTGRRLRGPGGAVRAGARGCAPGHRPRPFPAGDPAPPSSAAPAPQGRLREGRGLAPFSNQRCEWRTGAANGEAGRQTWVAEGARSFRAARGSARPHSGRSGVEMAPFKAFVFQASSETDSGARDGRGSRCKVGAGSCGRTRKLLVSGPGGGWVSLGGSSSA